MLARNPADPPELLDWWQATGPAEHEEFIQRCVRNRHGRRSDVMEHVRKTLHRQLHLRTTAGQQWRPCWSCTEQGGYDPETQSWPNPGHKHGRPEQLLPDTGWMTAVVRAGRGMGKTRLASEQVLEWMERFPGLRGAIVAPTYSDVLETCLLGESGLIEAMRRKGWKDDVDYRVNRTSLSVWTNNGSQIRGFYADQKTGAERLRGPQHHFGWWEEPGSMTHGLAAWTNYEFGLRLPFPDGSPPRSIVTGTPRRVPLVAKLEAERLAFPGQVILVRGRTLDNRANLAEETVAKLERDYGGTELGRQELDGELLDDVDGALWTSRRILHEPAPMSWRRSALSIDPAVSSSPTSDETGIIVGIELDDGSHMVVADASGRHGAIGTAEKLGWPERAVAVAAVWGARVIVLEDNQGGDSLVRALRGAGWTGAIALVHAKGTKGQRATPVARRYPEKVKHASDAGLDVLEAQMTTWIPDLTPKSPDRVDALVHLMRWFVEGSEGEFRTLLPDSTDAPAVVAGPPGSSGLGSLL